MVQKKSMIRDTFDVVIACFLGLVGISLFLLSFSLITFANPVSKGILVVISIFLISCSFFFIVPEWHTRIVLFLFSFFGLLGMLIYIGMSGYSLFDASAGVTFDSGRAWVAFDTTMGVNFVLITNAVRSIFPWAILALIVIQLLFSGTATQFMKALIKGGVLTGFCFIFANYIIPAF